MKIVYNRRNLEILLNGLKDLQQNPNKYGSVFDMRTFYECQSGDTHTCGTVGCVIGHAPYFGIRKHRDENWTEYSCRVFFNANSLSQVGSEWYFLFGAQWSTYHNTIEDAIERIEYFMENGVPPRFDSYDDIYRKCW